MTAHTKDDLRDAVVKKVAELGTACAFNLTKDIHLAESADEIEEILEELKDEGVVRAKGVLGKGNRTYELI